jgi:hypothetical protein
LNFRIFRLPWALTLPLNSQDFGTSRWQLVITLHHVFRASERGRKWQHLADVVAKRFWVSEEATLIQDHPAIRKVDSKICSLRFDCCAQAAPRRLLQQYRPFTTDQRGLQGPLAPPHLYGCLEPSLPPQGLAALAIGGRT